MRTQTGPDCCLDFPGPAIFKPFYPCEWLAVRRNIPRARLPPVIKIPTYLGTYLGT